MNNFWVVYTLFANYKNKKKQKQKKTTVTTEWELWLYNQEGWGEGSVKESLL